MRAKVELFIDLDAVAADAGGALDPEAQVALYDTLEWFRLTRTHILPDAPLLVVRARSGDASAWLFLAVRGGGRAEAFGSWYTLRFAPVFSGAVDDAIRLALLTAIAGALKPKIARLGLEPLAGPDLDLFERAFGSAGWSTGRSEKTVNWVAHTTGEDFAQYWARRPGQLRSTVKRKAPKANLTVRLFDSFVPEAWRAYEEVFAASWKGGEEGSPAFLRAVAQFAAKCGRLRMAMGYHPAGEPLAAQMWTVDGPVATIHKLAYVDAAKALSPGSVLSHAMFAHILERDRPEIIDFGTGDDAYKADWMDEKRLLYRFEAYNRASVRGLAAYVRGRLGSLVATLRKP